MNTNFTNINGMIINVNAIDALFPCSSRIYGSEGYTLIIGGHEIHLNTSEAEKLISKIELDQKTDEFDPDKRIAPTTTATTDAITPAATPATKINKIREAVANYVKEMRFFKATVTVTDGKLTISRTDGYSESMVIDIQTGIIETDTISTASSLKSEIIEIIG